ncbi:MAG: hypothetical protein KatS3mg111_1277 [Pirellulaceae bacterium]|nr:MAG: hypothetical protein KatS3mg111_1277 [Pirellulaceae bacterium]
MAPRLTILLPQSSTQDPLASRLEEQLLTEIMLTAGLDATLVGPLERMTSESTDCLCLQNAAGRRLLLCWCSLEEAKQHWRRLGLSGRLTPIDAADNASSPQETERPIAFLQLTAQSNTAQVMAKIKEWQRTLSVTVVPLTLAAPGRQHAVDRQSVAPASAAEEPAPTATQCRADASSHRWSSPALEAAERPPSVVPTKNKRNNSGLSDDKGTMRHPDSSKRDVFDSSDDADQRDWEHLDRLIDELDESGI